MSSCSSHCVQGHYNAGTCLGFLVPVMGNCNVAAYKVILYSNDLPSLWQQFEEEPHMLVMVSFWPDNIHCTNVKLKCNNSGMNIKFYIVYIHLFIQSSSATV